MALRICVGKLQNNIISKFFFFAESGKPIFKCIFGKNTFIGFCCLKIIVRIMSCNLSERLSKPIPVSSTKIEQKQKRKDLQKKTF